ncbi:hypothetical protein BQ8482_380140 [Mesorhizobium delmotii]|uniref:Uncharacterized protein n=1 Tax=Mesorhizobium delmotii TaxID=1631247 RepID=A0A2P9AS91_9HYPH|nr:hypothetical protein BQ8482_380140 [Mesorhizobium delmotii]
MTKRAGRRDVRFLAHPRLQMGVGWLAQSHVGWIGWHPAHPSVEVVRTFPYDGSAAASLTAAPSRAAVAAVLVRGRALRTLRRSDPFSSAKLNCAVRPEVPTCGPITEFTTLCWSKAFKDAIMQ